MAKAQREHEEVKRYVGTKETVGFVLWDAAQNVGKTDGAILNDEFCDRILVVSREKRVFLDPIITIWDGINDLFMANLVDRTRTRWGKFKPWLVASPFISIIFTTLFFLLPFIFKGTAADFLPKLVVWTALNMIRDLAGTGGGIARVGLLANITPSPGERVLLLTKASFFSMFGEDLPMQILGGVRDIIANNKHATTAEIDHSLRSLFIVYAIAVTIIAGGMSLWFAKNTRERVVGAEQAREESLSVKETIKALIHNRPLLMMTLSEVLGNLRIPEQRAKYTTAVLNFSSFNVVSGIPGAVVSYASYAAVPPLRRRFSTKFLWILSNHNKLLTMPIVYFFGRATNTYTKLLPMLIAFGIQTTFEMGFYGLYKVIPEEMRNECIDYGEWKMGYRAEGMSGALKDFSTKASRTISDTISNILLVAVGFKQGKDYTENASDPKISHMLFALTTILPAVTSVFSLIPKLLYNVDQKTRKQMYADLEERRALARAEANRAPGEEAAGENFV